MIYEMKHISVIMDERAHIVIDMKNTKLLVKYSTIVLIAYLTDVLDQTRI